MQIQTFCPLMYGWMKLDMKVFGIFSIHLNFNLVVTNNFTSLLGGMLDQFSEWWLQISPFFSQSSLVGVNGKEGSSVPSSPLHSNPSSPHTQSRKPTYSGTSTPSPSGKSAHSIKSNLQRPVFMHESCFVVRCEEFFILPVTTSNVIKEETAFLSSDKKALYLPTDMPAFQLDFTQYYYPGSVGSAGNWTVD